MTDFTGAIADFDRALALATTADAPFDALRDLTETIVGVKLFTFMTADMKNSCASRTYTSHPVDYPVSGTKPIHYDRWFEIVHKQRQPFVANTLGDIATVFADYELIGRLGCGSVINLPVILADTLVGTVNILHEEHHYTPQRVALARAWLSVPAKAAYLAGRDLATKA